MQYGIRFCIGLLYIMKYGIGRAVISLTDCEIEVESVHVYSLWM